MKNSCIKLTLMIAILIFTVTSCEEPTTIVEFKNCQGVTLFYEVDSIEASCLSPGQQVVAEINKISKGEDHFVGFSNKIILDTKYGKEIVQNPNYDSSFVRPGQLIQTEYVLLTRM